MSVCAGTILDVAMAFACHNWLVSSVPCVLTETNKQCQVVIIVNQINYLKEHKCQSN